jgi:hypothetical protein
MVTRIDRLARSIGHLQDIVRTIRARGAVLKATEQPIDTGTAAGKCFLDMLGGLAEFETNLGAATGRHRQNEGCWGLQGPSAFNTSVAGTRIEGARHAASNIAKVLKIGRASVYRGAGLSHRTVSCCLEESGVRAAW